MPDFIPRRDAKLVTWANNFTARINSSPEDYGLTVEQAAELVGLRDAFVAAYQTANAPLTRSPSNIIAKDLARKAMVDFIRVLGRIVRAMPSVTAEQRSDLGLSVPSGGASAIGAPDNPPGIEIVGTMGSTVRARLFDWASPTRRGKPAGVAGAAVFSYVGSEGPTDPSDWTFCTNTTRTSVDIAFDAGIAPGAKVWVMAYWYSPTAQRGPGSRPVWTHVGFISLRIAA